MGSLPSPRSDTDKHDVNHGDGFIKAEVVDQTIQGITFTRRRFLVLVCAFLHTSFHVVSVGFEGKELVYFDIHSSFCIPTVSVSDTNLAFIVFQTGVKSVTLYSSILSSVMLSVKGI